MNFQTYDSFVLHNPPLELGNLSSEGMDGIVSVGDAKQIRFLEGLADYVKTYGKTCFRKAARH